MTNNEKKYTFSEAVMKATGKIEFQFTNDGMFKLVLQDNEKVLKGLISSMLHIPEDEIQELKVENPIVLGERITEKTFVLDIKVLLNNKMVINLEMQVLDYNNWQNRSLSYLCRNFDKLQKGEDYISAKPVIHIGFLDFDLFEGDEEFYSLYRILNVKTYREYNGNFGLNVLYLNRTENATKEDKAWNIDRWAKLFKAKTWEELRMIAEKNETMVSAVETMYEKQSDDMAEEILRRKQDEINHQRRMKREREELEAKYAAMTESIANLEAKRIESEAKCKDAEAKRKDAEAKRKDFEAKFKDAEIQITNLRAEIEKLKMQLENN